LDIYCMSRGVEQALQKRFVPFASLQPPVLPAHPDDRALVGQALDMHADRLQAEFAEASPEVVLTLGNAALRVLRTLLDAREPPDPLSPVGYGRPTVVLAGSHLVRWYALAHPGALSKLRKWRDLHQRWRQTARL
jgi:uracil-DNA glycosylase